MEYVPNGDLYNLIERRGRLPEPEALLLFQQLIAALAYCHKHKVVHRDIKPENILMDEDFCIQLGDFGLSNIALDGLYLKTSCGSPNYAAPEVISGVSYCGTEIDVWSSGVVLYALVAGFLPFDEATIPLLFNKIRNGKFAVPHSFSPGLNDLIQRMLNPDPLSRITINQIQHHPWFTENLPSYLFSNIPSQLAEGNMYVNDFGGSLHQIDEEIFKAAAAYPRFVYVDESLLRDEIVQNMQSEFHVTYQIILERKHKVLRRKAISQAAQQSPKKLLADEYKTITPSTMEIDDDLDIFSRPTDWGYGIRVKMPPEKLTLHIFGTLRQLNMEWRIVSNLHIRVRSLVKDLKMEFRIYKYQDFLIVDIRHLGGNVLKFFEATSAFLHGEPPTPIRL